MSYEIYYLIIAGACGALVKDLIEDGALQIPFRKDGKFYLGFFSSMIIGAFAGYAIDGGLLTAAMGGFMGSSTIAALLANGKAVGITITNSIEELIRTIAITEKVDPELAVRVAKAESNLNPKARNTNTDGSIDRGLYQINSKYHPEVTETQADDPIFAAKFFCTAVQNGNLSWWNASRNRWQI